MRLTGQIRRDEGMNTPLNPNSAYKVRLHTLMPICVLLTSRPSLEQPDDSIP
jgi:hypothetical protein